MSQKVKVSLKSKTPAINAVAELIEFIMNEAGSPEEYKKCGCVNCMENYTKVVKVLRNLTILTEVAKHFDLAWLTDPELKKSIEHVKHMMEMENVTESAIDRLTDAIH